MTVKKICKIRNVYRAIAEFESAFEKKHDLCLNEGMLLCTLADIPEGVCSGDIAEKMGLTQSNASKVIRSVEGKGLITRKIDGEDKRKMRFRLTVAGHKKLEGLSCGDIEMPDVLAGLLKED